MSVSAALGGWGRRYTDRAEIAEPAGDRANAKVLGNADSIVKGTLFAEVATRFLEVLVEN